nr:unnamed protein product [Callosobruchus chinensis]CAH7753474.1 unnamed protein product [Callosobruchus chinensis]CAH7763405.1 unnamed protein product [Callosobruchus chinensis]CAH7763775.1 unnamed protein product [Callosobruchus chinensis]
MCVKANTCLSGLFRLLDNRFLPPPAKVKQTVDDLVLDEGGQFLDLPANLALRLSTTQRFFANALRLFLSDGKIEALKPNMQNVWSLSCFRQIIK